MQKLAIKTRDRTLLVSAAAGSGKTATLTERIISSILDEENPISIGEMLIVTFTRAAVGELRERIGAAITDALLKNPGNEKLLSELHLLPTAKISTIDAYCAALLRDNCDRAGVNPGFRIADTAEAEILAEGILDGLISAIYEGREECASASDFERVAECMTDTKSEGELAAVMLSLYNSTLTAPEGLETLRPLVEEYNPERYTSFENTRLGRYAMDSLHEAAASYKRIEEGFLVELMSRGNNKLDLMISRIEYDIAFLDGLLRAERYSDAVAVFSAWEHPSTPSVRDNTLPPVTAIRAKLREDMKKRRTECFSFPEDDIRRAAGDLYRVLSTLLSVLLKFDTVFRGEKNKRGILEYSDIERYAYLCLYENGDLSEVALAERENYKAVYIDEYQDVNALQDRIFTAVSGEHARFMVGDIKQSIYGFRSADTEIFAGMKKTFPKLDPSAPPMASTIFMSENFRCDRGIINFVNDVFDSVFYRIRTSIGYEDGDRLGYAKIHEGGEPEYSYPEICISDKHDFPEGMKPIEISAAVTARKIKELLDAATLDNGQRVSPGDIAIIMRDAKGKEGIVKRALEREGIPAASADGLQFFLDAEVLLALSLLFSVDNPRRDVYLAGLMCSPLFGFSPDELVMIRAAGGDTLFGSVKNYVAENPEETKCREFLSKLDFYRELSLSLPTDELIYFLFNDTGLLPLAEASGGGENLMLLYENARRFESGSYLGLYNFLAYIESVIGRKNSFDKREAPKTDDAVKVITAHSSKGLEYPIVFLLDSEKSLAPSGLHATKYEYSEDFGIGMYTEVPSGIAMVENPTKAIIKEKKAKERVEEEARVLYVALTRAREKLFVVATKTNPDKFQSEIEITREYLDEYSVYQLGSYLDMMLMNAKAKVQSVSEFLADPVFDFSESDEAEEEIATDTPTDLELADTLTERFAFRYPNPEKTRLPRKVSVSKLYPEMLDGTESETEDALLGKEDFRLAPLGKKPAFMKEKTGPTATDRGIATHMFLQFCDLDRLEKIGAEGELRELVKNKFLSERDAEIVRLGEIDAFLGSRLFLRMKGARRLLREQRFNVMLPAGMFGGEGLENEKLLVQGVIDCLIEDTDGRLYLVDYKTDRLTKEELADREKASDKLRSAHRTQLGYYAEAVKIMFGRYPERIEVYSMHLGDTVDMNLKLGDFYGN